MKRAYNNDKPLESKFHNKEGNLTMYSFACGYVERYEDGEDRLTLFREPGGWQVKGFVGGVHIWESFDRISDARKFCRKASALPRP
jgi:hypothetical protein